MPTFQRNRPYQQLIVWKEAHALCLSIYTLTKKFPNEERFGLVSQMRRSSSSVPTNIAEGSGKKSVKEREHFFEHASCSLEELHYQCYLSLGLEYVTQDEFKKTDELIGRVGYLLMRLRAALQ